MTASPIRVAADGKSSSTLTLTLKDGHDIPISGHAVSLSQGSGSSTITPLNGTTDASGQTIFTVTNKMAETVTYTAADTTDNVTITQTAQVTYDALPSASWSPTIDLNGISLDPNQIDVTKPSVTLEVTPKDGVVYVTIPASILTGLGGKNANFFIEIKTPYGSYQVPVNLASLIPGLKDLLASNNLTAEDISFKIVLADKSGDKDFQAALASGLPNGSVLGAIVDFHINILNVKTGQTIGTADKFSKALTRMIPMPKNLSAMPAQWGAFRYNETAKKFDFVAAKKIKIDGVWYEMISSYSNSVYVVAENTVSFADMQQHWGKSIVELAAAKGIVEGVGENKYAPGKSVTRAEFAAMLVRALGRGPSSGSTVTYDDVKPGLWYWDAVAEAKALGLLDFANGNRFMPNQPLTREEMASMLTAAVSLENLALTRELASLDGFKDLESVNPAYADDIRLMIKLQIMIGTNKNEFNPHGETTRAQAAVVLIRTLQTLEKMDR